MSKSICLGNNNFLIGLDEYAQVYDLYYPYVGLENHTIGDCVHRVGVWVGDLESDNSNHGADQGENQKANQNGIKKSNFSWFSDGSWQFDIDYRKHSMVGQARAYNPNLGIEIQFIDAVSVGANIFVRKVILKNLTDTPKEVRMYFNHQFQISESDRDDTAVFDPEGAIIHYKGDSVFLASVYRADRHKLALENSSQKNILFEQMLKSQALGDQDRREKLGRESAEDTSLEGYTKTQNTNQNTNQSLANNHFANSSVGSGFGLSNRLHKPQQFIKMEYKAHFDDYSVGLLGIEGREGTYKDAEDGELSKNPVEHGLVDSVLAVHQTLAPKKDYHFDYYLICAHSIEEAKNLQNYLEKTGRVDKIITFAENYWQAIIDKGSLLGPNLLSCDARESGNPNNIESEKNQNENTPGNAQNKLQSISDKNVSGIIPNWDKYLDIYKKSVLLIYAHTGGNGSIIASCDSYLLKKSRGTYSYVWMRDAALTVRTMIRAGYTGIARKFFDFCVSTITPEGYFWHKYRADKSLGSSWHPWTNNPIQEDETALVVIALGEYLEATKDLEYVSSVYDALVRKPAHFFIEYSQEILKQNRTYSDTTEIQDYDSFKDSSETSFESSPANTQQSNQQAQSYPQALVLPQPSYDLWEEKYQITTFSTAVTISALQTVAKIADIFGDSGLKDKTNEQAEKFRNSLIDSLWFEEVENQGYFIKGFWVDYSGIQDQKDEYQTWVDNYQKMYKNAMVETDGAGSRTARVEKINSKNQALFLSDIKADLTIDSSSLYGILEFGLLPINSQKANSNIQKIEKALLVNGGITRYNNDNYFRASQDITGNPWIITTLWVARYYIQKATSLEDLQKPLEYMNWCLGYAKKSGVMSEQINVFEHTLLSATPLVWSQSAWIDTVLDLKEKLNSLGLV